MRKFLCLYLNTGGGHKSAARVFKSVMEETYPDCEVILEDGLVKKNIVQKFLIETMYPIACNYIHGAWSLFYRFAGKRFVQELITSALRYTMTPRVRKLIIQYNVSHIVSFHFLLTPHIVSAIRQVNPKIKFTVLITDPFTATNAWFYESKADCIVASEKLLEYAVLNCGMERKRLKVLPFLIDSKFHLPPNAERINELKKLHNIPLENKVLLITGGGDGLPKVVPLVQKILLLNPNYTIVIVCGRDIASEKLLLALSQLYPQFDIRIMGFISNMDEMIHMSDCAIVKAGPATVFELLCSKKPIIISTYLHNQELGNMQFAVKKKVGWYLINHNEIAQKAHSLLNDTQKHGAVTEHFNSFTIDTDTKKVVEYVYNKT